MSTAGATVDRHLTLDEAVNARQSGLDVVVLGVGSVVNGSEAAVIATHDDSGVVYADNFDHLLDTRVDFSNLVADKICESDNQPTGGSGSSTQLWSCSFEQRDNAVCGMTQERSRDQFDWTVHTGRTPSEPTGPTSAHGGSFYAYIETSNPRRPNDEAWLILPKFDYSGAMCVEFYYHMYGHHVRSLRLVQRTATSAGEVTRTVWMRSRDMGTVWYHGSSQVDISSDSQLVLVGTRGDEYSGDIAIDDLKVSTGACR